MQPAFVIQLPFGSRKNTSLTLSSDANRVDSESAQYICELFWLVWVVANMLRSNFNSTVSGSKSLYGRVKGVKVRLPIQIDEQLKHLLLLLQR